MNFLKVLARVCLISVFFLSFASTLKADDRSQGAYVSLNGGELYFSGTDRQNFRDGWVTGVQAGYDFLSYLGVEGIFRFSGHNATDGTPDPGIPQSFFVYQAAALVKGEYPVSRRVRLNLGGGGGFFYSSPNFKGLVGTSFRGMWIGQLGAEYFLRIRGLSIGLDPSIAAVVGLKSAVYQVTGFLRYTF